jgi:hypothetical protein
MSTRYGFQYGVKWAHRQRPRTIVGVVPVIAIYNKKYRTAGQAATTIAWLIVNNVSARFCPANKDWKQDRIDDLYVRARRRVLPICKRLLRI